MRNLKYIIGAIVIVVLGGVGWAYYDSSGITDETEMTNRPPLLTNGESTCANIVTASELNSIFGVNNFAIQTNSGVNCIWATGDIKNGIGGNILALSLNVAKIGAMAIALGESTVTKNGGTVIAGVAHAYLLEKEGGVVVFSGEYMYSFGVSDANHSKELIALAKLLTSKN